MARTAMAGTAMMGAMRLLLLLLLGLFGAAGAAVGTAVAQTNADGNAPYVGIWHGTLAVGPQSLRLELTIEASGAAGLAARLVSLDQSPQPIPASGVSVDATGLRVVFSAIGARFEGTLADGKLTGTFRQGGAAFPLTLAPGRFAAAAPPPSPAAAPPSDPQEREVTVQAAARLAGTLRLPKGEGPFPAVLLLTGSGPQDRDVTFGPHKVFATLAAALGEAGIASLRLDDRGVGGSEAVAANAPSDLAADAVAALAKLRAEPGIRGTCVGFVDHSEGSTIALLAAAAAEPAFIVSLAGPFGTLADILTEQGEALGRAAGAPAEQLAAQRALQQDVFTAMRTAPPGSAGPAIEAALVARGLPAEIAAAQGRIWGQPYAVAALDLEIAPAVAAYPGPLSAIFAAKDLQVLPGPNSERLRRMRGAGTLTVVTVPEVNHLFQTTATGLPTEYASAPHAMAPAALDVVADQVRAAAAACR